FLYNLIELLTRFHSSIYKLALRYIKIRKGIPCLFNNKQGAIHHSGAPTIISIVFIFTTPYNQYDFLKKPIFELLKVY
ncbi:hypothetical protein, partial [Bacillus thuringiensis]|uniref:hypothetical protein n=1 Tax=Bacillus thuringiensis TaxID=1428 RepID=UPI001A9F6AAD